MIGEEMGGGRWQARVRPRVTATLLSASISQSTSQGPSPVASATPARTIPGPCIGSSCLSLRSGRVSVGQPASSCPPGHRPLLSLPSNQALITSPHVDPLLFPPSLHSVKSVLLRQSLPHGAPVAEMPLSGKLYLPPLPTPHPRASRVLGKMHRKRGGC